jgi:NADH:ubiquinone oxidoreductase subunit C
VNVSPLLDAVPSAATFEEYGRVAVDVDRDEWGAAVVAARDGLGCSFFDFLSAVDEGSGFRVVCHVVSPRPFGHLVLRTLLPQQSPSVASVASVYAGAGWHERETAEMFGIAFLDVTGDAVELAPLLLRDGFEGHPLRKEYLLESRLDRPWPGAKEPGESDADASRSRRRMRPPGVPENLP